MRFNYKTRRVLQLARRRTPHPRSSFATPDATPMPLAPFPFRRSAVIYGLIHLIFPATPNSIVLSLVFLASARTPKTTSPLHPFCPVKDSRIARPRTPASRLLLAVAISGRLDILPIRLVKYAEVFLSFCRARLRNLWTI